MHPARKASDVTLPLEKPIGWQPLEDRESVRMRRWEGRGRGRGGTGMAGSGDPGFGELAGAHTDAHRKRIRCSDGRLNRLIGPALGEIGDRWRDGGNERGRRTGGAKESDWAGWGCVIGNRGGPETCAVTAVAANQRLLWESDVSPEWSQPSWPRLDRSFIGGPLVGCNESDGKMKSPTERRLM